MPSPLARCPVGAPSIRCTCRTRWPSAAKYESTVSPLRRPLPCRVRRRGSGPRSRRASAGRRPQSSRGSIPRAGVAPARSRARGERRRRRFTDGIHRPAPSGRPRLALAAASRGQEQHLGAELDRDLRGAAEHRHTLGTQSSVRRRHVDRVRHLLRREASDRQDASTRSSTR